MCAREMDLNDGASKGRNEGIFGQPLREIEAKKVGNLNAAFLECFLCAADRPAKLLRKDVDVMRERPISDKDFSEHLALWSRDKEIVNKWTSRWFVERNRYPTLRETVTFI